MCVYLCIQYVCVSVHVCMCLNLCFTLTIHVSLMDDGEREQSEQRSVTINIEIVIDHCNYLPKWKSVQSSMACMFSVSCYY